MSKWIKSFGDQIGIGQAMMSFFSKESIIWWTIKTYFQVRKKYKNYSMDPKYSHIKFIRLKTKTEVECFLANLNMNWQPLSPLELKSVLQNVKCEWAIAGGWAIDLFLQKQTRKHADIDLFLKREDQLEIQTALKGWELWVADPPGTLRPWKRSEFIKKGLQDIWCRSSRHESWQFQIMLYDVEDNEWIYKRDESIRRNLQEVLIDSKEGFKILAPEIQLLYKSKSLREKDEADFKNTVGLLSDCQREWLKQALSKSYKNGHTWLESL